jgi:hypothetical protein
MTTFKSIYYPQVTPTLKYDGRCAPQERSASELRVEGGIEAGVRLGARDPLFLRCSEGLDKPYCEHQGFFGTTTEQQGGVMPTVYTATKSRSQGREAWAVIFRHPLRVDADGKPGRRVRRGLGTCEESQADTLVEQLNELLSHPEVWEGQVQ